MGDEAVIKSILLDLGLYSLAMAHVKDEGELMRTFRDDFESLVKFVCLTL